MDERQTFLDEILNNPDDDTVRLVYADWLDDHDEPDRAKFIRLQIERSKVDKKIKPEDDATLGLLYDARDLLADEEARYKWWPRHVGTSSYFKVRALSPDVCSVEYEKGPSNRHNWTNEVLYFHRGFVNRAALDLQDLVGGCTCQQCGNTYRRSACAACNKTGAYPGLMPFLLANPIKKIYLDDIAAQIEIVPPGVDHMWQAYWYRYRDRDDLGAYFHMTGGHTRESLFEYILKRAAEATHE